MPRTYATLGSDGLLATAQRPAGAGLTKLTAQTIQITQTSIAHGLGGTPSVVIIVPRGVSFVYESAIADATNVYLTAAGLTTCDIYVALLETLLLPTPAAGDVVNLRPRDAVPLGEDGDRTGRFASLGTTQRRRHVGSAYLRDLLSAEFGMPISCAAGSSLPTLGNAIGAVVGVRAQEQMRWIDAPSVVAVVENVKAVGNRAVVEFPRQAMSERRASAHLESAISIRVAHGSPFPAFSVGIRVAPKPQCH